MSMSLTVLVGTALAETAHAKDPEGHPLSSGATVATVPLTVDCSQVPNTTEALNELKRRNLCGLGSPNGSVSPQGTVVGNCGSLTLNLFDHGSGFLHWQAIITSSLGPMVSASYSGEVTNLFTGWGSFVSQGKSPMFSTRWENDIAIRTGSGVIFGEIFSAKSVLAWGLVCTSRSIVTDSVWVR